MSTEHAAQTFFALADTNRLRLLRMLGGSAASATALAARLDITRQAVDKHLGVLHRAGFVRSRRDGRQVVHSVRGAGFDLARGELVRTQTAAGNAQEQGAARRLCLHMQPTDDLATEVESWLALGLEVLWRPDAATVLLGTDGRAAVMCEDHPLERSLGAGPVFVTRSLDRDRPDGVSWRISPCRVPSGRYAAFVTAAGRVVRMLQVEQGEHAALFGGTGEEP